MTIAIASEIQASNLIFKNFVLLCKKFGIKLTKRVPPTKKNPAAIKRCMLKLPKSFSIAKDKVPPIVAEMPAKAFNTRRHRLFLIGLGPPPLGNKEIHFCSPELL